MTTAADILLDDAKALLSQQSMGHIQCALAYAGIQIHALAITDKRFSPARAPLPSRLSAADTPRRPLHQPFERLIVAAPTG